MKVNQKIINPIVISVLVSIFLGINLENVQTLRECFNAFAITDIVYVILYYLLFSKTRDIKDKRAKICCSILATIFALCEVIGYSICKYCDLSCIIGSRLTFLKAIFKFIGYFILLYNVLLLIFVKFFSNIKIKETKEIIFFTHNKKSFFVSAIIIFLCYLPYLLCQYPGIISIDSVSEISTSLFSMNEMVNHHPIFHIFIISLFMNIGKAVNNYNLGIALYSIFQMIFTSMTFSFVLCYMSKKNVNLYIRIICLIIFALYPPFASYAITMWKDVPFGLSMVFFTISMLELSTNQDFLKGKNNIFFLILTTIMVILLRNNGIYVVVLSIPFMIFFIKKDKKIMTIISALIVILYVIWKGPIFDLLNVKDGPIREALSIPLQQIARTVKYRVDELTAEEKTEINRYMPIEEIGNLYYPLISDNVKDTLNNDEVKKNKFDFIKLWSKLFIKYPKEYVEAFLSGSYGYWYPEAKNWVICEFDEDSYTIAKDSLKINVSKNPILNIELCNSVIHTINYYSIPFISGIFSIGLMFFAIITMLVYVIYKKKYNLILVYLPVLFLWLTSIASPVWCEYRYVYSLFTCAPILIISIREVVVKDVDESKG